MKKFLRLLSACLCLFLLSACASSPADSSAVPHTGAEANSSQSNHSVELTDTATLFATFRIVDGAETGNLMLAENGEVGTSIYALNTDSLPAGALPEKPLQNGQLINICFETVMESYPLQLGGISAIAFPEAPIDNRAALYLRVLEDLWNTDSGLNDGVEMIGADLSQTSLSPAEQAAVAWVFASRHGAEAIQGTLGELTEQSYITATPLSTTGSGIDGNHPKHYFYEWKNGCHFSIVEQPMEGTYSLTPVTFDAQKWRSSLGAYYFADCTAVQSARGEWSDYQIGSEMIS